ncbi:MAG: glycosyltransferase family 39 protein [Pseudomonadales bacterium]
MWRNYMTVRRGCYALLLLASFISVALYLQVALGRIAYPYQIEWIEGGIFQQVIRIIQGQSLYGLPSMEFAPALYTPLFHYLSALVASIVGHSLFALRLVSFVASLMTGMALVYAVKRYSGSWSCGLIAVGFYFSTYRYTGFWFDVGRVDGLWVMWLAWSVAVLIPFSERYSANKLMLSAIFFSLALFTKQASLFVLPFFCWLFIAGIH